MMLYPPHGSNIRGIFSSMGTPSSSVLSPRATYQKKPTCYNQQNSGYHRPTKYQNPLSHAYHNHHTLMKPPLGDKHPEDVIQEGTAEKN